MTDAAQNKFDVIVIGAGITGLYQLHKLRELGLSVKLYETGDGVGGTWYWNKYPGCRFDSESETYGYSWSKEVLQEWNWTEHFAPQPETERYLNFVADKFKLHEDIQLNSCVAKATFDEANSQWDIELDDGSTASAGFVISATGPLNAYTLPNIPGIESFQGDWAHTARYPKDGFGGKGNDFSGKRVGVIGTGATGVQLIQEVAKTAAELTVFQLLPEWVTPLHNGPMTESEMTDIKKNYSQIFEDCSKTMGAFRHDLHMGSALEATDEEREAFFEEKYSQPGFAIWLGNYADTLFDPRANELLTKFIEKKIRARINDPELADKLIPKNHGFGTRRVPQDTGYYEVYNQDNVKLVSLLDTPIEEITATGVKCSDQLHDLDIIIYATGFDAIMGSLKRIDITGKNGQKLTEKWSNGPRTLLGIQAEGFPNFFTLIGPHNGATFCNIPRCSEQNVEWVTDLVAHMKRENLQQVEASLDAENAWTELVDTTAEATLFSKVDSWFTGVSVNNPQKRTFMLYTGGQVDYRERCDEVAKKGYEGFVLS